MSVLPASGYISNAARTNAEQKLALEEVRDAIAESLGGAARSELTISGGAIVPPDGSGGGVHTIDTEGNAASDDLTNITTTNTPEGRLLLLQAENVARVVTVKHAAGGAGQITLIGSADFAFATLSEWLLVQRRSTDWVELARGYGTSSALVAITEATPYTTYTSTTSAIPIDDTVPQNTEGLEVITVSHTPKRSTNRLVIEATFTGATSVQANVAIALFQDSTANALAARFESFAASFTGDVILRHEMAAGTTSSTTFKIRVGVSTGTLYVNGGGGGRLFGGLLSTRLRVEEYAS